MLSEAVGRAGVRCESTLAGRYESLPALDLRASIADVAERVEIIARDGRGKSDIRARGFAL